MINRSNYEIFMIDYLDGKLNADQVAEILLFLEAHPDIAEEFEGIDEVRLDSETAAFNAKKSLKKEELPIKADELDLLLAKKLEGDLTNEETVLLDELLLGYPQVGKSWKLFQLTRLPASDHVFESKDDLLFPETLDLNNDDHLLIASLEGDLTSDQQASLSLRLKKEQDLAQQQKLIAATALVADESIVFPLKSKLKRTPVIALFARVGSAVAAAAAIALFLIFSGGEGKTGNGLARHQFDSGVKEVTNTTSAPQESENIADIQEAGSTDQEVDQGLHQVVQQVVQQVVHQDAPSIAPVYFAFQTLPKKDIELLSTSPLTVQPAYSYREIVPYVLEEPVAGIQNNEDFPTVRQFLGDKVKEGLWGGKDYPQDDYTLALLGKAADKYNDRSGTDLKIGSEKKEEKDKFFLRIGKLTISR